MRLKIVCGILLALLIVGMLGPCFVVLAGNFNVGDTVEVINCTYYNKQLVVRDIPGGNPIGTGRNDGDRGTVLAGPQSAYYGVVLYTWWKVHWQKDSLEGWSAEGYPGGVAYLTKVYLSDLTFEDIWVQPDPPSSGGYTNWGFRIKNQGAGDASGTFYLDCYFDNAYVGRVSVNGLLAGSTYTTYWQSMIWPSDGNPHVIKGVVDPTNTIIESNEANNILPEVFQASAPINQPPSLGSGSVTPTSGDTATPFSYYVTYRDPEGDVPSVNYVYIDGSPHSMTKTSGDYVSGAVFGYSTTLSAGSHNYYFSFNDGHSHPVTFPTSGTNPGPSVSAPSSDLTFEDIWVQPDPPSSGGYTNWGFRIKNQGAGDASGTFYLDCYFDNAYVGRVSVNGLLAGSTYTTYWQSMIWPSDGNPHVIKGVVDPTNTIIESNEANNILPEVFQALASEYKTLTVNSSPTGVSFTANGVSHTTPWSETFAKDTPVSLEMDSVHYAAGASRYYWSQWSDGVASRFRTVILSSDTTVTGSYVGPYYELDITPSVGTPSGIPFTLNGITETTPYSEWLHQGYYTVEMPATYNGYVWQYWLGGDGQGRITTVSLTSTATLIFVYKAPHEPSLSIPVYAPIYQSAHQGTTLGFFFRVSNTGATTDTINLGPRNQRLWNIWLSEDSVRLEPNQGKDVCLFLTVGGTGDNIITIEGTSEADHSRTSSCEVIANGYDKGYGLFNVELKFSNTGTWNARLLFSVPVSVKISASEIYLPGFSDSEASIYVAFDPTSWINDEPGQNGFLINVEEIQYDGGTAAIPVKFDGYVTAATDFDLTEDSYSFPNGEYEYDTCYGMAATAIHNRGMATYDKTKDEAKFGIKLHQGDANNWALGLILLVPGSRNINEAAEYTKLKKSINLNVPMILALHTPAGLLHAVVAYKIVESGSKAYILCYDNNEPFSSLSDPQSFTYALYDTTTQKLLFCVSNAQVFEDCEFLVHKPAEHPIVNWVVIYEGKSWVEQIVASVRAGQNLIVRCPVNATITDQYGRIVSDNGTNQIPNATVASTNDTKYFCLPLELNCSVFINAYGSGDFNLVILKPTANSSLSLDIYEKVSVNFGTHATLEITPHQMNQTMKIDNDGDGVTDELRSPSVSVTIYIPLLSYTFPVVWGEETFIVSMESNSTVGNFAFNQPDKKLSFDVSGSADTIGFCNVTIPKALLYGEPWTVLIDGASVPPIITENATYCCLYFTYAHSTHEVQIVGTWVIGPLQPPPTYGLTITTTVGGTTDPTPGTYSYAANSTVQVTAIPEFAIPEVNILFEYWELDSVNVGSVNPYTVLMDKNHTLKAVFSLIPQPLSVSISPLSASIPVGQPVTFTSTVSGGYTPYTYQWYLNDTQVSGATMKSWNFTPTTLGTHIVHLRVTDAYNSTVQSETARIVCGTSASDVNRDGKVDLRDISLVAIAFGSYSEHPRWNPIADLNQDDKIDLRDIALVAKNFGKTYS